MSKLVLEVTKKCSCCKEPTNFLLNARKGSKTVKDVCPDCYEDLTGSHVRI